MSVGNVGGNVLERLALVRAQMRALAGSAHPDLDDLVQSALEQLQRARFEAKSQYATFAYGVSYRVWLRHLRTARRYRGRFVLLADVEEACPPSSMTPLAELESQCRSKRLRAVIGGLSHNQRTVLVLHDIEGLNPGEIAQKLALGVVTVRSRLKDARATLAKRLRG
jgi:RNA polymerase sigma-70 factor, ECF subfamily